MSSKAFKTSRPVAALMLGLAATLLAAGAYWGGLENRLELGALDLRFAVLGTAPVSDRITLVEIDDRSLESLGRWPWPREQLAGIVETLLECGARTVAVDVILPDPQETRYVCPATELYTAQLAPLIGLPTPVPVFDDAALASVLQRHPNVFLPMHMDFSKPLKEISRRTRGRAAASGTQDLVLPDIGQILARDPQAGFARVWDEYRGEESSSALRPSNEDLARRSYLRCRAVSEMKHLALPEERFASMRLNSGEVIPPLVVFASKLHHSGFVTATPDADGVVRRTPLLARGQGGVYPQFAFAIAADELGRRHGGSCDILPAKDGLLLRCADGWQMRLPTDQTARMLINWPGMLRGRDPCEQRQEISAAGVGQVWQQRQRKARNERLARRIQLSLAQQLGQNDLLALFQQADAAFQKRVGAEATYRQAILFSPAQAGGRELEQLTAAEAEMESRIDKQAAAMLESLEFYLKGLSADDPRRAEVQRMDALLKEIAAANVQIDKDTQRQLDRLRWLVSDRICLLGSTATGAPDFQVTPLDTVPGRGKQGRRTAGVAVHAHILNTILTGRFIRQAPPVASLLAVVLAGAVVSLITASRPVLQAAPLSILTAAVYAAVNAAAFAVWGTWLALVAPLAAMGGAFVVTTVYRQLTEERAKRHIRGLFAQALSPALVDRLIEDPSLAQLGGRRATLSCLVSDLTGFTALSEAMGESRTVAVLNRYFDRMTEVIQARHGGYLNKFLGDGILAFFGAPVPQEDHAARAIRAAVDCQEELAALNDDFARQTPAVQLTCRIGLATGAVMVGNCGSSQRMDYTAIGNPVNLASRLESANKHFGTRILACEETFTAAGLPDLLARPLGKIGVAGRSEPVRVWDIACRRGGAVDKGRIEQAFADFARAVECFERRRFVQAAELFSAIVKVLGEDKPSLIYLELCRSLLSNPPGDDWDGAVRLTEK
jgi:class 3 adenylate cyclase/CHASE2 domain-containing sensor protein